MKKTILMLLALSAAQAAAQSSAPQPAPPAAPPTSQTPPAAERKAQPGETRLNLKLDQPASLYVRETQPETAKSAGDSLPGLGGATTSFERPIRDMRPDSRGKYPMDVENLGR
jgi:hypothetical protein